MRCRAVAAVLVPVLVVSLIAAAATFGWLQRDYSARPDARGFPLFSALIAERPGEVLLVACACAAAAAAVLLLLGAGLNRSLRSRAASTRLRLSIWLQGSWWRFALVLLLAWSPWIALRWPGAVNADFALMVTEIVRQRDDFAGAVPPYDVYPIAHSLIPAGDLLWSNQHNALLTLLYGAVTGASGVVFSSYVPGIVLLSTTQLLFTVLAFARAIAVLARFVRSDALLIAALAMTSLNPLIPVWALDLSKNPLFGAAFVWWLALIVESVLTRGERRRGRLAELVLSGLIIAASAKFGMYVVLVGAILLVLRRRRSFRDMVVVAAPALAVLVLVRGLTAGGIVIPDDSVESRSIQMQQIALTLREDPAAISVEDREALVRIFDIDAMTDAYRPDNVDPIKSSGFGDKDSYRWQSVEQSDWDAFNGIWLRLGIERPDLYADALLLKTHRYLDPLDDRSSAPPLGTSDWRISYPLDLSGVNDVGRQALISSWSAIDAVPVLRLPFSASAWTVLVLLLVAAAFVLRRPEAFVWSVPIAMVVGVALVSPLGGSARYLLGAFYAVGIVLLCAAARPTSARAEPIPVAGS